MEETGPPSRRPSASQHLVLGRPGQNKEPGTSSKSNSSFQFMYITGASSLKRAINSQPHSLKKSSTAISSLTSNPNVNRLSINLPFLLESVSLKNRSNLVLWHDLLNNSVTSHKSNIFIPLTIEQLIKQLLCHKERISDLLSIVIVLELRNYFEPLEQAGFLVIRVTKNLISPRKQQSQKLISQYSEIHPPTVLELKSLNIILQHSSKLKALSQNTRRKTKRLSKKKRRLLKKRQNQNQILQV